MNTEQGWRLLEFVLVFVLPKYHLGTYMRLCSEQPANLHVHTSTDVRVWLGLSGHSRLGPHKSQALDQRNSSTYSPNRSLSWTGLFHLDP